MATNSKSTSAPVVLPVDETVEIINTLRDEGAQIVGAALGTTAISSFAVGSLGNFPYYYENTANTDLFNTKTYDWINANLAKGGNNPAQQDVGNNFSTLYQTAITSIGYTLSTKDQAALNKATSDITDQQVALQNAWKAAFGHLPAADGADGLDPDTVIDEILHTIQSQWTTDKNTTLIELQQSNDLSELLGNTPASGQPVLPVFSAYLNALGESISIQNSLSLNGGYLASVRKAISKPTTQNGAIMCEDNRLYPSYKVATPLSDIINGLKDTDNSITLSMSVSTYDETEYSVSVNGKTNFKIRYDFFTVGVGGNANYFHEEIAKEGNTVNVELTYTGVTSVQFGPTTYNSATNQDWFFMKPITDAIVNQDKDITGYHFDPNPEIDFTSLGNFGYLQGLIIANYPTVKITVTGSNYESIQTTFQQTVSSSVSFLGIKFASGSQSTYSNSVSVDSSSSTVSISLTPPETLVAGTSNDSVGYVLGVQTVYPASM